MSFLARLSAATCFTLAAFAWIPPFLDRAGTAALGFAFLSFAVGRAAVGDRPALPFPAGSIAPADLARIEAEAQSVVGRIGAYSAAGHSETISTPGTGSR